MWVAENDYSHCIFFKTQRKTAAHKSAPCGDDELLIPIANAAKSALQTTINLYMKNSLQHYKDEDERHILLGCC